MTSSKDGLAVVGVAAGVRSSTGSALGFDRPPTFTELGRREVIAERQHVHEPIEALLGIELLESVNLFLRGARNQRFAWVSHRAAPHPLCLWPDPLRASSASAVLCQ